MTVGDLKKQFIQRSIPDECEIYINMPSSAYAFPIQDYIEGNSRDKNEKPIGILLRAKEE